MKKKTTHFSTFKKLLNNKKSELESIKYNNSTLTIYLEARLRMDIINRYEDFLKEHGYYSEDNTKPNSIYVGEDTVKLLIDSIEQRNPDIVKKVNEFIRIINHEKEN